MYNVVGKNMKWYKNANRDATKKSSVTPLEKEKNILSGRSIAPINWFVNKQKLFENYGGGDEGSEGGKSSAATCILWVYECHWLSVIVPIYHIIIQCVIIYYLLLLLLLLIDMCV